MPSAATSFADSLPATGEMPRLVRSHDWSKTELGPIESWPQSLRIAVGICMNSRFPMFVWWGPKLLNVYNDAYIPVLGKRHPQAFGRPARDVWGEIWDIVGPQAEAVMARGEATWNERVRLDMERNGYAEETYFTWSYSPIPDEAGGVGGVFCACTEETAHVRAERERNELLRRAETERARLAEAFAQSPAFLAVLRGPEHVFEFANERYYQLIGRRGIIGKPLRVALPEVAGQGYFEILDRVYSTGEPYVGSESRVMLQRQPGGPMEETLLDFVYQPMRGSDGSVVGILVHGVDVTERRFADQALRQSEAAFRQLADAMPQIVFAAAPDGSVDYFNRQWYEYTGLPEGDTSIGAWRTVHTEEGFRRVMDAWPKAIRSGTPYEIEYRLRRRDGQYRWHLARALPIRDERGKIVRWFGTNTDIHDRKVAEAALRESESRLRLAQTAGRVGVFEWVMTEDRIVWSPELERLYGVPEGTFEGKLSDWEKRVAPEDVAAVVRGIGECVARKQQDFSYEFRAILPDGSHRWLAGQARFIYDELGQPLRMIGVNVDLSERKRSEEERETLLAAERAARAEAERASRMKDDFLATLSHELRTPLTPVLLSASLLEAHPALPEELREDVASIRRNVELESRLISDLLDLTRIAKGKLKLEVEAVDLHRVVRSAIDICQREASARLLVDLRATRHTVRGDSTRLQQIFWNLVNNAQKFTGPDGTIVVRSTDVPGGKIRVEVADTGAGIDPSVLPRLFSAFEQGEIRAVRQQAGLGLGLSISKRLAESHGGTIKAASEGRGKGATFTVELPVTSDVPAPADVSGTPLSGVPRAAGMLDVLLVEDHEATLNVMTKLLRALGHRVTGVGSVASAKAMAKQSRYDVIISDLGLPDGSGLDVMRELKADYGGRAIALTGYGMESDVAASREAGFAEHLTKPVDLSALQAAIHRVARGGENAG